MTKRPLCLVCLLLMAFLCLADWMGLPFVRGNPLPLSVQAWIAQHPDAVVCGEAVRCTETEYSQSVYLKNTYLIVRSNKIPIENIRIFLKEHYDIPVGTVLMVSGKMEEISSPRNPGEFDSQQYYGAERIYYFMKDCKIRKSSKDYSIYGQSFCEVRQKFQEILAFSAGSDAPAFEAILLGEKENLEEKTKIRYQMGGIIHILAISGLHISLLGMGFYKIMQKAGFGVWSAGIFSLIFILQYGMMTGGSVSTMRAVCMFLLSVGAKILGRCYDMLTALSCSGILLLLDCPANLFHSSFLLSFGAVLGIGTFMPVFIKRIGSKHKIVQMLLGSVAVQLFTLPMILWFYGEVSVAGIVLNLLVLPTIGAVLISGVAGCIVGLISLRTAEVIFFPGRILLHLYETICEYAGKLPFCTWIGGKPFLWQIWVYYGVLIFVIWGMWYTVQKGEKITVLKSRLIYTGVTVGLGIGIFLLFIRPLDGMRITCLDVGQGDGIAVQVKDYCFLIDGGSSNKGNVGQYQLLPFFKSQGIQTIDFVFISHTDEDHINGVRQILEFIKDDLTSMQIGTLVLPMWKEKPEAYIELEKLAEAGKITVVYVKEGDILQTGKTMWRFYAPLHNGEDDINENGMVMEMEYGKFRALFTGDIGEETESKLLPVLHKITFLKTAHHGSAYSTSDDFLHRTLPRIAVISCSSTNTYGHPSLDTVKRLEEMGCQVEYTMHHGAIVLQTDGERVALKRFVEQ